MKKSSVLFCLFCLFCPAWLPLEALGQSRSSLSGLSGQIADEARRPIKGASVRLVNTLNGEAVSAASDEQGQYQFPRVRPGSYRLEAGGSGFETIVSGSFEMGEEAQTRNLTLLAGAVRDQVIVSASPREELVRETAIPTTLIERREIEDSATQTLETKRIGRESVKLKLLRNGQPMEMPLKTCRQYFRKQRTE